MTVRVGVSSARPVGRITSARRWTPGVAVLPGRYPVLVAGQLATLAGLASRRGLLVSGLKQPG